jgi:hypothetical protein
MKKIGMSKLHHLLFVLLIFALTGCGASKSTTAGPVGNGSLAARLVWADKATAKTVASLPTSVAKLRMTVTGAGVPVVRNEIDTTGGATSGSVNGITPGTVSLVIQALDAGSAVLYEGFALNVVVTSGNTTDVGTINMTVPTFKAADVSCLGCHELTTDGTGQNLVAQYKQSSHYTSFANISSQGAPGCAGCHGSSHNTPDPSANGTSARCFDCHRVNNATLVANHGTWYLANGTECVACHQMHNTKAGDMERKTWAASAHGATDFAGMNHNTGTCARCHNAKGLIQALGAPNSTTTASAGQQMITCDACHTNATLGTLRVLAGSDPFTRYTASARGYKGAPFNKFNPAKKPFPDVAGSNICIVCHGGTREGSATTLATSDAYFVNFSSAKTIAPHNLPAAAIMYVKFGFTNLSTGTLGVPTAAYLSSLTADLDGGAVTSTHRKLGTPAINGDSHNPSKFVSGYLDFNGPCAVCHLTGSHSLKIDEAARVAVCANCHTSENTNPMNDIGAFDSFFIEPQKEVYNNAINLAAAILNKRVADLAITGVNFYTNTTTGKFGVGNTVANTTGGYSSYTGDLRALARALGYSQATGALKAGDLGQQKFIGALSNLILLSQDQGGFAHARTYVRRLAYDSLDFLDDGVLNRSVSVTAKAISLLPTIGGLTNPVAGLYTKGTNAYNSTGTAITSVYSGTSESMLFLIGWSRSLGTWNTPERP